MNQFRNKGPKPISNKVTPHRAKNTLYWLCEFGQVKQHPLNHLMALAQRIKDDQPKVKPRNPEDTWRLFSGRLCLPVYRVDIGNDPDTGVHMVRFTDKPAAKFIPFTK